MHRSFPACWSQDDKALKILRGVAEHYKLPMLNYENLRFFKLNREIELMFVGDSKWRCVRTFSGIFHDQMSLDHPKGYRIVNKWWLFLVGGQKPTWLGIMHWPMGILLNQSVHARRISLSWRVPMWGEIGGINQHHPHSMSPFLGWVKRCSNH